ncbi:MAG: putative selenate reductase subunit YgfK [Bacteroidetes bacterium]|nr:putative selenate reductase subunit YgfK [Bacteroidota bacterium]
MQLFGQKLESPIGVAAGPHTQLAQNIVAAWLCGARFIELKTVQTLDELDVSKPCIDMQDEGYNCEWSQELKIKESFDQYLNAWILIHILKDKFKWGEGTEVGTIFNMSVGYNYEGILNKNVQWFFDKMADASLELEQKIQEIKDIYPNVINLNINPKISDNITLSTMHGCPPEEIERIGEYLIKEKNLHTTIKLNPTLLGRDELQKIIQNSGFETTVPDIAFEHDLKFEDAVNIISRLSQLAKEKELHFGIKLTNTLESLNFKEVFPAKEKMMYASGRILHPISINLAKKLQNAFSGKLNISFSGGADAFNITNIISSGLYPVTVCTDILKPGGYGRLHQYLKNLRSELSGGHLQKNTNSKVAFLDHLNKYAKEVTEDSRYKKTLLRDINIKTDRALFSFDCINAPCVDTCPTNQNIPAYLYHTAKGDFEKAFEVIIDTNPFPYTTGMVCDHLCQSKCTRINYDSPVLIREIKRFITERAENFRSVQTEQESEKTYKVGIIGAGPAGLSAARFLREAGFEVDVYEEKQEAGGMVSSAIPSFRLNKEAIDIDIRRIKNSGVKIIYGVKINKTYFEHLQKNKDFIFIATGAQKVKEVKLKGIESEGVLNPLDFLFQVKKGEKTAIGQKVLILGGGNTAMDAARTAKRLTKRGGTVKVVYRRTKKQMPADFDEIIAAQNEGIEIMELVSPVKINAKDGKVRSLTCQKMKLGGKDSSGRLRPVGIPHSKFELETDTIIPAFGQQISIDFIPHELLKPKPSSYETQIPNVFIGGDAMRGGSTVIHAVADGRKVAREILEKTKIEILSNPFSYEREMPIEELIRKRSERRMLDSNIDSSNQGIADFNATIPALTEEEAVKEASRCLHCDVICNICTTVCPNLSLYPYSIQAVKYSLQKVIVNNKCVKIEEDTIFEVSQNHQILHLADWCNECGNCTTFCPTSGSPYKDKPHVFLDYDSFQLSNDAYYYDSDNAFKIYYKYKDRISSLTKDTDCFIFEIDEYKIKLDKTTFRIIDHNVKGQDTFNIDLIKAAEMSVIMQGIDHLGTA